MKVAPRPGGAAAIRKIVLHLNVGPEVEGGAQSLADYLKTVDAGYHEIIDNKTYVQCARPDQRVNGAAGMNDDGYHICVIGTLQTAQQWADAYSKAELNLCALRVAARCHDFSLPPALLTDAQIADINARGICDHWGVNRAIVKPLVARGDHSLGPGDHTDVGAGFPWVEFIGDVVRYFTPAPPMSPQKVKPMYDPPLGPIAAVWQDTKGRVLAAVAPNGDVYAWGVPYRSWPTKAKDFGDRQAAQIGQAEGLPAGRYTITSTSGNTYTP